MQAISQGGLRSALESLRGQFDFILVDSAPVLPVADSLLISQEVDAVLFSVLRQVSRLPAVYAAYEKLLMLGVRVLGTIVHGMPRSKRGYSYGMPAR